MVNCMRSISLKHGIIKQKRGWRTSNAPSMLYPTLPDVFHFQPPTSSRFLCHSQRREMDCLESVALKSSLWGEMATVKSSASASAIVADEICAGGYAGEDFLVDELFDFSNEEEEDDDEAVEEEKGEFESLRALGEVRLQNESHGEEGNSEPLLNEKPADIAAGELAVPADELAELEWLSQFVDDSFSHFPAASGYLPPAGLAAENSAGECRKSGRDFMETHVPSKARSKRSRTLRIHEAPVSSSSSSNSTAPSPSPSYAPSCLIMANTSSYLDLFYCLTPPDSKPRKRRKPAAARPASPPPPQRRCSHCHVQKTPQWRTGPLGSKTLCNACGVRYKSGRLLPEYRPAGSPTFLRDVHSNSHRKVLEMRRRNVVAGAVAGAVQIQTS